MSTVRITNISSERIWIRDLYTGLAPGEMKEIVRTPAECGSMGGLQTAISDGQVTVTVIPDSYEIESKLVPIWPLGFNWRPSVEAVGDLPASENTLGDLRIVTDTLGLYGWDGAAWQAVGGGGGGSVTNVTASAPLASTGGATPNITLGTVPVNKGGTGITSAGASGNILTSDGTDWASVAPAAAKQLGSRIHWVVAGGLYATIQAAIDAASAGDAILVGPAPSGAPQNGSWGPAVFPENKRLVVSGLTSAALNKNIRIDSVTFSPSSAGLQINENEVYLSGLYILGTYATGQQAVLFGGTNAGRLRLTDCYIVASSASTGGDCIVNSNSFGGTSLYLDSCTIQNTSASGRGIRHSGTYTLLRRRGEVSGGEYAIEQSAGTVEIYDTSIEMNAAREVVRISAGTMTVGYSTIKNSTANGSGVNLTAAGAVLGMGDATFAIATGTGFCVNGVASSVFLYGHITYSNSAAAAFNTRVRSTVLTALATAQSFTAV